MLGRSCTVCMFGSRESFVQFSKQDLRLLIVGKLFQTPVWKELSRRAKVIKFLTVCDRPAPATSQSKFAHKQA